MNDEEIKRYIDLTVDSAVLKMKMSGLIKEDSKTALQKTEEILRNYQSLKGIADQTYAIKLVVKIEDALKEIESDPYYDIIPMYYFLNEPRKYIASKFGCNVSTVSRNRLRLLNILKTKLYANDVVVELFF